MEQGGGWGLLNICTVEGEAGRRLSGEARDAALSQCDCDSGLTNLTTQRVHATFILAQIKSTPKNSDFLSSSILHQHLHPRLKEKQESRQRPARPLQNKFTPSPRFLLLYPSAPCDNPTVRCQRRRSAV